MFEYQKKNLKFFLIMTTMRSLSFLEDDLQEKRLDHERRI